MSVGEAGREQGRTDEFSEFEWRSDDLGWSCVESESLLLRKWRHHRAQYFHAEIEEGESKFALSFAPKCSRPV